MVRTLGFLLALTFSLIAGVARADEPIFAGPQVNSDETAQPEPPRDPAARGDARLRFGIAGSFVGGHAHPQNRPYVEATAAAAGLVLDLGVQINDFVALYVRGEAASVLFSNHAAAYVIGEWTPVHWLSIGTGLGASTIPSFNNTGWTGASVPLVLGLNVGESRGARAIRRVFRIGLEGAGGFGQQGVESNVYGWHTALSFGGAWM